MKDPENSHKGKANRLIEESSPYLLQHAYNPVDWYPWKKEALDKAKRENKLMIISIGYAACHWCHVMERESFEDTVVAQKMNANYVSIKIDREERPDIDQIYMDAAMLINGRGGWPLNIIALPDSRPVFAGTYFPKENWIKLIDYFMDLYQKDPEKLRKQADQLTEGLQKIENLSPITEIQQFSESDIKTLFQKIYAGLDVKRGGRTGAPKFPLPNKYEFLMEYYYHTGEEKALQAVKNTLDNMANGGIYDHLGGGFARYSTDDIWKVPHFEKMLYDNGQLVSLYSSAYQLTGNPLYKKVVYETLGFIKNELTSSEGGFYSSFDADSEGEEGKFYVWEYRELAQALSNDLEVFADYYSVSEKGNWEGNNILYRTEPADKIAERFNLTQKQLDQTISKSLDKLKEIRSERIPPPLDDKVLTSWNALMLKGYLDAYRTFGEQEFLEIALKSAMFIRENMLQSDFRLNRNYKNGKSTINGFLDDYSFTINAFISLYQATFQEEWLLLAKELMDYTLQYFYDQESSAFFYTSSLDDPLIARKKELTDNVIPGSNSAMAKNLITLGNYFYVSDYKEKAQKLISNLKSRIMENPGFHTNWGMAMIDLTYPIYEVAIVGEEFMDKRSKLDKNYLPNALLLGGKNEGSLELLENKLVDDQTFIYVCLDKACKLPTTEVKQALTLIK